MKIIGQGESGALIVNMSKDDWAMLSGYANQTSYLDGGWNFNTGTVKDMTKTLDQIRWCRAFASTLQGQIKDLSRCQRTMEETMKLIGCWNEAKLPAGASESEIAEFKGLRPLIRPVQPDMAGLHTDGGFDMYPHVNPVGEQVGIAPDAEL